MIKITFFYKDIFTTQNARLAQKHHKSAYDSTVFLYVERKEDLLRPISAVWTMNMCNEHIGVLFSFISEIEITLSGVLYYWSKVPEKGILVL